MSFEEWRSENMPGCSFVYLDHPEVIEREQLVWNAALKMAAGICREQTSNELGDWAWGFDSATDQCAKAIEARIKD